MMSVAAAVAVRMMSFDDVLLNVVLDVLSAILYVHVLFALLMALSQISCSSPFFAHAR